MQGRLLWHDYSSPLFTANMLATGTDGSANTKGCIRGNPCLAIIDTGISVTIATTAGLSERDPSLPYIDDVKRDSSCLEVIAVRADSEAEHVTNLGAHREDHRQVHPGAGLPPILICGCAFE
jgi:hypothetical protein